MMSKNKENHLGAINYYSTCINFNSFSDSSYRSCEEIPGKKSGYEVLTGSGSQRVPYFTIL